MGELTIEDRRGGSFSPCPTDSDIDSLQRSLLACGQDGGSVVVMGILDWRCMDFLASSKDIDES